MVVPEIIVIVLFGSLGMPFQGWRDINLEGLWQVGRTEGPADFLHEDNSLRDMFNLRLPSKAP